MSKGRIAKKVGIGCGAALLLFVVLVLALPTRKIFFPKKYDVVSIKTLPEYQNPERLKRAFALPVAAAYGSEAIAFQENGSLCGPTSLINVRRSFGEATVTRDTVLAGTGKCSLGVCFMGLTLDELADIARREEKSRITVLRDLALPEFRKHLEQANDPKRRYLINFDRGPLFGTEGGHHSPIGGYLAEEDLVLVLDVNQKYKPWLVKAERLHRAMDTIDGATDQKRGLLLIERSGP